MIDSIDDVPMLIRREIEARIIASFVDALATKFGRDDILAVLRETIQRLAREHGQHLAHACGGNDLEHFHNVKDIWSRGGALELTVLNQSPGRYDFNVTRCRYAEMYRRLGIPELGEILSCSRDATASEGFNPDLRLTRTQTILAGADYCDFRYNLE